MKPHLWFVRAMSRLVPRRWRLDWMHEWDAELKHRESLGRSGLFRRSLGSFWDALAMQPRRLEDEVLQDVRYGMRMLLKNKFVTSIAVLSLGIGIGANTAVFSAANAVMFRSLPVNHPEELVRFEWVNGPGLMVAAESGTGYTDSAGRNIRTSFSALTFERSRAHTRALSSLAAYQSVSTMNVSIDGNAQVASGLLVSGGYYRTLGVQSLMGRTVTEDDDRPDASPVAVLNHRYWERAFGGDPAILGKTITINTVPFTIIGITSQEFFGTDVFESPDIFLPLATHEQINVVPDQPWHWWLRLVGRLNPGATADEVRNELQQVFRNSVLEAWDARPAAFQAPPPARELSVPEFRVMDGSRGNGGNPAAGKIFSLLMAIVGFVLLIVCANVANLLLARAAARQNEIAVRSALGARRRRLVRQLLVESGLLALCGASLGVLLAFWGKDFLSWATPADAFVLLPTMDLSVLVFVAFVTVLTVILFGLVPGLRATQVTPLDVMKNGSRTVIGSRSLLTNFLSVSQIAISLILLTASGIFLRSLANVHSAETGFDIHNLVVFRVDPVPNKYSPEQILDVYDRMVRRFEGLPGVQSVTQSQIIPLSGGAISAPLFSTEQDGSQADSRNYVQMQAVRPNFFATMKMPILRGRSLADSDKREAPLVGVINQTLARRFFGNDDPLGKQVFFSPRSERPIQIVGVVRDAKYRNVREDIAPAIFFSHLQRPASGMAFEIRTASDASRMIPVIREAAKEIDPNLPLIGINTQAQVISDERFGERLFAVFSATFGSIGLLLSCMGLYGLMSYRVARRTNEIGIRLALGADRTRVLRHVMRETLVLVLSGVAIGSLGALATTRVLANLPFGLAPYDPATVLASAALLIVCASLAGYLPARRATRVDPMTALRYD